MQANLPTVVVIEDSAEVRGLITARLRLSGLFRVVGEGSDGSEAVGLAYRHRPSLLLLDLSMPVMDGLEALPGVLAVSPATNVVVYSGFEERGLTEEALELGAVGFIEKSLPIDRLVDELLTAVRPGHSPPLERSHSPPAPEPIADGEPASTSSHEVTGLDDQVINEHVERFREVFDQAAIGMATMTLTGNIVRANQALAELMLSDRKQLIGLDYGRLTAGRGDLLDAALLDISQSSADVVHFEHDVAGTKGPRKVRATLAPVRDSWGQPLYVFLQVQDITEQRAAEDQLRRSEERFRLLTEAVREYEIFMLDPDGHVISWNAGAERSKGYTRDEIIGQHFRIFYPPEKRAERYPEHELQVALRDGHYEEEGWRLRKDGTRFWANVVITAVFNEMGEHIGFTKVTRDVTERRRAEQERDAAATAVAEANAALERLNAQLQRAAADQAQFLAVTAHELRTPTSVLSGAADMLAGHWDELNADERAALFASMTTSATRLQRLVSDLLTASKLDADALRLRPTATALSDVMAEVVNTIRATWPDADVVAEVDPGLEVLADGGRLAQALENVIGNSLQHGEPPVRVVAETEESYAVVRVTDAGQGVTPAMRPRLFDRFTTGDGISSTGLGLYIARELTRAQGGDVTHEAGSPETPAGAFVLSIPLTVTS